MNFSKRFIALALAFVLAFALAEPLNISAEENNVAPTDWMAEVNGDMSISSISIPGTHDSATQYITPQYFLRCQNTDFETQLNNGIRYLDIRVNLEVDKEGNARLKFIHNFGKCRVASSWFSDKLYLEDCLDTVYAFLDEHPTETVIFVVKAEKVSEEDLPLFEDTFFKIINQNRKMWYKENEIPTLDEVRGKIVLGTRFDDVNDYGESEMGLYLHWDEQNNKEMVDIPYEIYMINDDEALWVQDHYKYNMTSKFDAVVDDLENCQADDNTLSLNFLSTSGSGTLSHPKKYAKYINSKFMEYELKPKTCYGVVIFDFANKELAEKIYSTNF